MPERKTTETQDAILAEIARAVVREKAAERVARIEAEELVRTRIKEARNEVNALIYAAEHDHRITKSAIAKRGLGNTNRVAVDNRINEHLFRNGGHTGTLHSAPAELAHMRAEEAQAEDKALTVVEVDGGGWSVMFDQFTHEDVGSNLSGTIEFDQVGQFVAATGDIEEATENNPLLIMRVWGLEEVQAGVRNAQ